MLADVWQPWAVFVPMLLVVFCQGMSLPSTYSAVSSILPNTAGAGSSLAAFIQTTLAALGAQLAGSMQWGSPLPMATSMFVCTLGILVMGVWAIRHQDDLIE